jgi:hypothetical protein
MILPIKDKKVYATTTQSFPRGAIRSSRGDEVSMESQVDAIILGKMYDYEIDKSKFNEIRTLIREALISETLGSGMSFTYTEFTYQKCDDILESFKFKSDLTEVLDK